MPDNSKMCAPAFFRTCHSAPPSDGSHAGKHGQYYGSDPDACARCHPDHVNEPYPFAHATSVGKRSLAVRFNAAPNSGGTYSGDVTYPNYLPSQGPARSGTCTGLYCHSSGRMWPCRSCGTWSACLAPATIRQRSPRANSHSRHTQSNYSCDNCHVQTVVGACKSCHVAGIPSGSMGEAAHVSGTYHVNKTKDVDFKDGGTYDIGTKKCSNTSCHVGEEPLWGGGVTAVYSNIKGVTTRCSVLLTALVHERRYQDLEHALICQGRASTGRRMGSPSLADEYRQVASMEA